MPHRIRIMMADDQVMFRNLVIKEIGSHPNYLVTGSAENGIDLLDQIKTQEPHVVLLDLEMPSMDGFEAFVHIRKDHPRVKIIILSTHFLWSFVDHFLSNGAGAFIPKTCDISILIEAIDVVVKQGYYLETLKLLPTKKKQFIFSERELQVLREVCVGKTNNKIAAELGISYNTVDFHRKRIYEKTETSNSVELVLYAVKHGIVSAHFKE